MVAHALACRPELVEGPRPPAIVGRGATAHSRVILSPLPFVILSPLPPVILSPLPPVILSPQAKDLVPGAFNKGTGWAAARNPHP